MARWVDWEAAGAKPSSEEAGVANTELLNQVLASLQPGDAQTFNACLRGLVRACAGVLSLRMCARTRCFSPLFLFRASGANMFLRLLFLRVAFWDSFFF